MTETIILIYTSLPGYMFKCIEKLANEITDNIILVKTSINKNYPIRFKSKNFQIFNFSEFERFINKINVTNINTVFISGWANKRILKATHFFHRHKVKLILLSDQPKKNNFKEKIGKVFIKSYLNKFTKIIVP